MTGELLNAFVLELARDDMRGRRLTEKTFMMTEKDQRDFIAWVSRKGYRLDRMGKRELLEYHRLLCGVLSKRSGVRLSARTINGRFHNVCYLFTLLYREGIIGENPVQNLELELPEGGFIHRRPLTRDEITRFLEHLDPATPRGLRDRTLFELMYSSGLRVAEVAGLKIKDINFDKRELIVRGKGDKDRAVPVSRVARDFLVKFLGSRAGNGEEWVFPGFRDAGGTRPLHSASISERFRTLLKRYGMDKPELSAHSIRHSTATHLLDNGASVRHVQELLGHKNIETTVRYTHLQTENLYRIYLKYHPREHELFEAIDEAYRARLDRLLAGFSPEWYTEKDGTCKPPS